MECPADVSCDHGDAFPPLSMLKVLRQRKRRRRVSMDAIDQDGEASGAFSFHRSLETNRSIPTKQKLSRSKMNASIDLAASKSLKSKRKQMLTFNTKPALWILILAMASSTMFFGSIQQLPLVTAFQPSRQEQRSSNMLPRFMSLATPPSSSSSSSQTAMIPKRSDLESMKVVDLKQLIKDSGHNERGLLSKLKKKQDLVEFLAEKGTVEASTTTIEQPPPVKVQVKQQQQPPSVARQKRKIPITMPKKKPTAATPAASTASDDNPDAPKQPQQSPILELFERVTKQYPPLEYLQDGNRTLFGELDIRQRYHPMLQAGNLQAIPESELQDSDDENSSDSDSDTSPAIKQAFKPALSGDMDLIFVGTASCTPSITRGVSCTALRLHSNAAPKINLKKQNAAKGKKGTQQRFDVQPSQSSSLGTWLFDCGESTQLQIQKTSSVRPSKITKIFLTHAHGDHSFGLPGLLCLMGQDTAGGNEAGERGPNGENIRKTKDSKPPIEIYGPEGLRLWLRTAIRYSVSRIVPRYRVHELKDVAMAPEWGYSPKWEKYYFNKQAFYEMRKNKFNTEFYWGAANDIRKQSLRNPRRRGQTSDWMSLCDQGIPAIERSELYGEVEGGRDIYPIYDHPLSHDGAPVWEVEHEGSGDDSGFDPSTGAPNDGVKVYAAPMSHGVPCVGYVVQEANRPGRLRNELVQPICERNVPALKEAGFRHPMKAMAVIKDLPEGGSFTFPDGTVVTQEEAVEPTRPGRKIVICGDTNSARALDKLAKNADVIVHESTNAFLTNLDHRDSNPNSVNRDAIFHGHSTPQIAGDFAKRARAKRLILNHFSARYMGDQSLESMSIMTRIEEQAMKASGLTRSHVAAAWDFMIFPIPKVKPNNESGDEVDEEIA